MMIFSSSSFITFCYVHHLSCHIPFVCVRVCVLWPPAAQNANANTDFANFDAFGSSAAASSAAFQSAPQAPFPPAQATGMHTHMHALILCLYPSITHVYRRTLE